LDYRGFQKGVKGSERGWTYYSTVYSEPLTPSPWTRFYFLAATGVAERMQNAPVDSVESLRRQ
jgi:hypothetical protein